MSELNYKQELLKLLQNNDIKTLPSKGLLESDKDFVIASWNNFTMSDHDDEYGSYIFEDWYKEANWSELLQSYGEDTELWEQLFKNKNFGYDNSKFGYNFILSKTFKEDFPFICDYFLKNNEKLKELFFITKNKDFFDCITLSDNEKNEVYKDFLINHASSISKKEVINNESDADFIINLLNKRPQYFSYLSGSNRNKHEYVGLALKEKDNYFLLSKENKELYFKPWSSVYMKDIKLKDLDKFTIEQQGYIMSVRSDLLSSAMNSQHNSHKEVATSCLLDDLEKNIIHFDDKTLSNFIAKKGVLEKIKPELENFVNSYNDLGTGKKDNKMVMLAIKVPEFVSVLESNVFYQIGKTLKSKEKKDSDWFKDISRKVFNLYENKDIKQEKVESALSLARNCLNIDALKELRIPKLNVFKHVNMMLLNEKLNNDLTNSNTLIKKHKI